MRLKKCYIDNFGRLSNTSFDFSFGINTVKEDNGFGKSTLAGFIKAMLFGLPDTKSTKLEENERRKFEPWQGGTWGGSLEFEFSGKNYRVERGFSKKASGDTVKIFDTDTGKELFFDNGDIGKAIFGIDRDGFERTVFLSEKSFAEKNDNASIAAKLSDLSGVSFDMGALSSAFETLEEQRKFYHKQSGSGAIDDTKRRITEAELRLNSLNALEKEHIENTDRLNVLLDDRESVSILLQKAKANIAKSSEEKIIASKKEEKEKRLKEELGRIEAISKGFPNGIPTAQQTDEFSYIKREIEVYRAGATVTNDQVKISPPEVSEEEIDEAASILSEIKSIKARILEESREAELNKSKKLAKRKALLAFLIASVVLGIILGALFNPALYLLAATAIVPIAILIKGKSKGESGAEFDALASFLASYEQKFDNFRKKLPFYEDDGTILILKARQALREYELRKESAEKEILRRAEEKKRYSELLEKHRLFTERFGTDDVGALRTAESEYLTANEIARRISEELKSLPENSKSAADLSDYESEALGYEEKLKSLNSEIALLKRKNELEDRELEEKDVLIAECEKLEEKLKDYTEKYKTVKLTKSYLELARDKMNARYLKKTMDSFVRYVSFIADENGEYGMDTSFVLSKREGGQTKTKDSYSKGTRELYDFALRLSLSDALYDSELPPLILDDPFAYFDDGKLAKAKKLLSSIAKERQIIYFVPVKERAI